MAALNELIDKIENPELRAQIQEAANKLAKQKKFGLVFEEHLPECTPLYDIPVKKGATVSVKKSGAISKTYKVLKIENGKAWCMRKNGNAAIEYPVEDLVVTAEFGEAIYPYLKPLDSVCNAPDSDLWHTLIEADNYHALQLLEYLYAGKVDCIYIDPPYNTGARDWKYNNDYVDNSDEYRHSKWLSMMQKRLKIAKKLLNPVDSVLIVTIDEKEYLHLGCLLEEMFPEAKIQMISSIINPKGAPGSNHFIRVDEYIYFVQIGEATPQKLALPDDFRINASDNRVKKLIRWQGLAKTQYSREGHPDTFYPIYVSEDMTHIVEIGDPIGKGVDRKSIPDKEGCITVWPLNKASGAEAQWSISAPKLRKNLSKGYVRLSRTGTTGIYYLTSGVINEIENGEYEILGRDVDGSIIIDETNYEYKFVPGTAWKVTSHDATRYGSDLITKLLPDRTFPFPKSLYAVHDAIQFFVFNKPNALIIDFFSGSGTTLHAVNLLNAEDGGNRRCIMVTNNEVSEAERKDFEARGVMEGSDEWNSRGIARYVTWPRTVCSIEGRDINGNPLKGNYLGSDIPMADGFKANAAFFKLGFLDKTKVSLGMQFKELLSTLWMKAGTIGECPTIDTEIPDILILPKNKMAILNNENAFAEFKNQLDEHPEIEVVYLVTDYEAGFVSMTKALEGKKTYQLYRDYLDNFRINAGRNSR